MTACRAECDHNISASSVAGMLYGMPVNKPGRVAKIDPGNRASMVAAGTSSQAVHGIAGSQSDTLSTPEQVHAHFEYALAALSSAATGTSSVAQPSEVQPSGIQQAGAYAEVEKPVGRTLNLTP